MTVLLDDTPPPLPLDLAIRLAYELVTLAHPTRLRLLDAIRAGGVATRYELETALDLTDKEVWFQAYRLRKAGLIDGGGRGKPGVYRLTERGEQACELVAAWAAARGEGR